MEKCSITQELKFITPTSAFMKSAPDKSGKRTMLLIESGKKVAGKLFGTSLLDDVNHVISYISHWHLDHYCDVTKVAEVCKQKQIPHSFLDFPDEYDSSTLYKNLKEYGITRPEMISSSHAEKDLGVKNISFKGLSHGLDMKTMSLFIEQIEGERNMKIIVPDNNDVKKCREIFTKNLDVLDTLYFDVTQKPQFKSSHLSIQTLDRYHIPIEHRPRFIAWHFPEKGIMQLKKDIVARGFGICDNHLFVEPNKVM